MQTVLLEPKKAHPTCELVIVLKYGGHALHGLAYKCGQEKKQIGSQTKHQVLIFFQKFIF